jgi:transglutaminase-like putative cysteine protease
MTLLVLFAWLPLIADIEPQVSTYIGLLIALRFASLRWRILAPGRWVLLPLTLAGMAAVYDSYHSFLGPEAGTALLATMFALKLLEVNRLRDIRIGTILFGFLLISQFLLGQSLLRVLYLALLLVLDIALMADVSARVGQGRQAIVSALQTAGRLSLQAFPLALALFVFFPRLSAPLWSVPQQPEEAHTGLSDWMDPGSINELVLSGEPAFRVRFDGPIPPEDRLYWRGPVIWHTDGRRWTGWPSETPMGEAEALVKSDEEIAYQVELEPTGKRWLFALDLPVQIPEDSRLSGDFQVLASRPVKDRRVFRFVSALSHDTGKLDLDQELAGTQLPENITPRMRALVAGWQQSVRNSEKLVSRALRFFREQPFYYSLAPPKLGSNPADEFLFETRRGFCEHYASSFVLLMRIAGISSRVVLGYLGGEHNPLGSYLLVRQSDAHAWAEVWLDGRGWVRVDPTAAVAPERVEHTSVAEELGYAAPMRFRLEDNGILRRWTHNLGLLGDAIETGWRIWVLGLSSARQQKMLDTLGLGWMREYGLAIALIVTAGVVFGLLVVALTRPAPVRDPLERIYARFCKQLSRIGLPRGASEGPVDYAKRVIAARPDLGTAVESFIALYLRLRYAAGDRIQDYPELKRRLSRLRLGRRGKAIFVR